MMFTQTFMLLACYAGSLRVFTAARRVATTGKDLEAESSAGIIGQKTGVPGLLVRLHHGQLTGRGKAIHWDLYRQGEKLYDGSDVSYDFGEEELHKQYIANVQILNKSTGKPETTCVVPIYVRSLNAPLCGTELFSKPELACDRATPTVVRDALAYSKFAPKTDRGFSLEFEFVGRDIKPDKWAKYGEEVRQLIMSETITDHKHAIEFIGNVHNLTDWEKIVTVRQCFLDSIDNPDKMMFTCYSDEDCPMTQYCMNCNECLNNAAKARGSTLAQVTGKKDICAHCDPGSKRCQPREACEGSSAVDCPPVLSIWNWERDGSVMPLTEAEAQSLNAPRDNTVGSPFEMTAPGPPNVLSGPQGMRGVMEVLTVLQNMGTQAGPSQGLHVHVNVASQHAPGTRVDMQGVAAIWAAWARYQLVIAEMLSPGRLNNYYAKMHVFGDCELDDTQDTCKEDPCPCTKRFFMQMHEHLRTLGPKAASVNYTSDTPKDFCNAVLRLPGGKLKKPCQGRYPNQRYFALNLVALAKFGTVEFRMHSASFDKDRIGRWTQFLVAFVEYFGNGRGKEKMEKYFDNKDWKKDYVELQMAQRAATTKEMFDLLEGQIDSGTRDFYQKREWEKRDKLCQMPTDGKYTKMIVEPTCDINEDAINPEQPNLRTRANNHIILTGDGRFIVSSTPPASPKAPVSKSPPRRRAKAKLPVQWPPPSNAGVSL